MGEGRQVRVSSIYAESSAVLRWLVDAPGGKSIFAQLGAASEVAASRLTTAEVSRTLRRLSATGVISSELAATGWRLYGAASNAWHFYDVTDAVLVRAGDAFPSEPLRILDAIHVATALLHREKVGPLSILTTDDAVRRNALALGFAVAPTA